MPQELRVVQCFKCEIFQVDIVKKAQKWICKLCGEKQSLRQEFYRGSGVECRAHVQHLNRQKESDGIILHQTLNQVLNEKHENIEISSKLANNSEVKIDNVHPISSKWKDFIETNDSSDENETPLKRTKIESTKINEYGPRDQYKVNASIEVTEQDQKPQPFINSSESKWNKYLDNNDNNN